MTVTDMVNHICAKGQIVLFSSGRYQDDVPRFLGRALRDFSIDSARAEFLDTNEALPKWEAFVIWLLQGGYLEPVDHVEIHMDAHWGERDAIDMRSISTQSEIVDMAAGKACPKCGSHHVVPETVEGHVDMDHRLCADCGHHFAVA